MPQLKNKTKLKARKKEVKIEKKSVDVKKLLIALFSTVLFFVLLKNFEPEPATLLLLEISNSLFIIFNLFFSIIVFISILYLKNRKVEKIYKYGFLLMFLALSIISLALKLNLINSPNFQLLFRTSLQAIIAVPLVALGIINVFAHQNSINALIEREFTEENDIKISEKSSFIKSFIKKEGVTNLIILSLIFFVAIFNFSYNLSHYDIFEDEFQMMSASTGYYHTGEFKIWNNVSDSITNAEYGVEPQIWLLAQAYKLFGLSKTTARGVSVVMGLIFVLLSYFFCRYFIRNKIISLLVPLTVIFFPSYLHLFRYIRMYALVIPITLIVFWVLYKGVTEGCGIKTKSQVLNSFIKKYLDFNFKYLIISIPLIIINYHLHQVSLITVPVIFVFIIYLAFSEKKQKYYIATFTGFLLILIVALFFENYIPKNVLTFFKNRDWLYLDWIFSYPFSFYITIPILLIGASSFFIVKNRTYRRKLSYFYFIISLAFVFFAFIAVYKGHDFRFVSHIVIFVIILSSFILYVVLKPILNKYLFYLIAVIFFINIVVSYSNEFESTYKWSHFRPWYSKAYKTIEDNIKPNEVVFGQYFQKYYSANIYRRNKVVNMLSYRRFTLDSLKKYQKKFPEGWITWASYKGWHLDQSLINYISGNFRKIHGKNIDNTNMEVYHYDKSMIPGTRDYKKKYNGVFNTNSYLKMNKEYSISFWMKAGIENEIPIVFRNYNSGNDTIIDIQKNNIAGWDIKYGTDNKVLRVSNIHDEKWHHIVIYKMPAIEGNKYGVIVDVQKDVQNTFLKEVHGEVQLLLPKLFKGQMKDLRIYNKVLTLNRVKAIYNNGEVTNEAKLWDGEKYFSPAKHFVRK